MRIPTSPEPVTLRTVADVIDRLEQVSSTMPAGDGVRAFNEMYLVTTRQVDAAIAGAQFADAEFLARLDVVFANLYLHALDLQAAEPTRSPRSWGRCSRPGHGPASARCSSPSQG